MILAAAACAAVAVSATADPRWWWHDAKVSDGRAVDVDVAAVVGPPPFFFFSWVEPAAPIETWVQLTASFDGGCTTCDPVQVLGSLGPDDQVAIAVVEEPTGALSRRFFSIAILHAGQGRLRVAHGVLSVSSMVPPTTWCEDLRSIPWTIEELSDSGASDPDVAAGASTASGTPLVHFHAVWRQAVPTRERDVVHARDLSGDGSAWEITGSLPEPDTGALDVRSPRVSVDFVGRADRSSVNVAYGVPDDASVRWLRSTDSGATFSGTGGAGAPEPVTVNEPGSSIGPIALDSGSDSSVNPLWHGLIWSQGVGLSTAVVADAQFQAEPTVAAPSWGPDTVLTGAGFEWELDLGLAVLPGGAAGEPAPLLATWSEPGTELVARQGRLEVGAATPVDLDAVAFPAVRPTDPDVSTNERLTACDHDSATGDCLDARAAGSARHPATADASGVVVVAWIDDRDGLPSPWMKRTNREIDLPPVIRLETDCSEDLAERARIRVLFSPVPGCEASFGPDERIERYLIYWGTDPGGPWVNTDLDGSDPATPDTIVVEDDGTLPNPVSVTIDDLDPGAAYHVVVVPEDEARNVFPPDFDPLTDGPEPLSNERRAVTPPECGAADRCLYRATSATLDASGLFAGSRDPVTDIAFAPPGDVAHVCPFLPGDADPDPVLAPGAPPLVFYQVDSADVTGLRLAVDRAVESVRITY